MGEETRRDWEIVQEDPNSRTDRLRIQGGWLYRTCVAGQPGSTPGVSMVCVPGAYEPAQGAMPAAEYTVPDTLKAGPTERK